MLETKTIFWIEWCWHGGVARSLAEAGKEAMDTKLIRHKIFLN